MKELLANFHASLLTAAEYAAIEDYLFGSGVRPPLSDEGVLDTVDYLKNMCERSGYKSLADLEKYYSDQHANLDQMFKNFIQARDN